ncbi:hypothetical protein LCGC14_2985710 [marine sediment metagenome]|uniref:Uncharacterized protein n=1 Tax=marine sediment metagenome TaxID=412755 RepID=A0A0F8ZWG0_9ZZZZ
MANQLTRYATVATVDTAGEGYFIGVVVQAAENDTGIAFSGVNQVWTWQFVLPFRATTRQIIAEVSTGGAAGKFYGLGLYDVGKNLLVQTGAIDAQAVAVTSTSVTAITLEPGVYWFAQTCDDAATQFRLLGFGTQTSFTSANENTARGGTAANPGVAGVLPATLGVVTANTSRSIILAVFEP